MTSQPEREVQQGGGEGPSNIDHNAMPLLFSSVSIRLESDVRELVVRVADAAQVNGGACTLAVSNHAMHAWC